MRKLLLLFVLLLVPAITLAQPINQWPLESVLQAGNNATDNQTVCFGDSDDVCAKYNSSTEDWEIDNTLSDKDVTFDIDNMPLDISISGLSAALPGGQGFQVVYSEPNAFGAGGIIAGGGVSVTYSGSGTTAGNIYGTGGVAQTFSSDDLAALYGLYYLAWNSGSGDVTEYRGVKVDINYNQANNVLAIPEISGFNALIQGGTNGTITTLSAYDGTITSGGTITNFRFFECSDPTTGTITNNSCLYIPDMTRGTNDYGIYFAGSGTGNSITFDAGDSRIYDDNTNLVLDPNATGSGNVSINAAYILPNSDGSAGECLKNGRSRHSIVRIVRWR